MSGHFPVRTAHLVIIIMDSATNVTPYVHDTADLVEEAHTSHCHNATSPLAPPAKSEHVPRMHRLYRWLFGRRGRAATTSDHVFISVDEAHPPPRHQSGGHNNNNDSNDNERKRRHKMPVRFWWCCCL